nr:hypothetical protein [Nocardia cyriacigeorgica]
MAIVVAEETTPEPSLRPAETIEFASGFVDGSVWHSIRPPRGRNLRVAEERGQSRQRAVETVVAATSYRGATIVDELSVRVRTRVRADPEPIAFAERILDGSLIFDPFDRLQFGRAEASKLGWIAESCRCTAGRDVVTNLAQIILSECRIAIDRHCRKTELVANLISGDIGVAVRRYCAEILAVVVYGQVEVGGCRVGGVYDIDQERVAVEQALLGVECPVD